MSYTDLLKRIWEFVYEPDLDVTSTVEQYFHPDYEQSINGVIMNRSDYIAHVIEQKRNMRIRHIQYKHIVEVGNEVFALYYPQGVSLNDSTIEAEVIAYFQFKEQKLLKIHGQVRLIKGNLTDVDM
ncbi:hypothetical protein [Fluoribacter gormanii]|uniref:SnoaL-like domain-containing protein n=1 Tax=Fluoribacter gormanii TaxID=464 RepID=A0A377GNW2_9GAMM|nr:hypothetical protein [Fluoribacter gormanii]KTD04802.1 hypothetical protein Lgor_0884 [Fluoribacter gormanii]SIR17690.1 hypothetical protein SAMN05421777_107121 [Fluoribacter gormanii]STO26195.1 Uncharacterised protein [Fluoribacter gormanii]